MAKFNQKKIKDELKAIIAKETKESLQSFLDNISNAEKEEKLKIENERLMFEIFSQSSDFFSSQKSIESPLVFKNVIRNFLNKDDNRFDAYFDSFINIELTKNISYDYSVDNSIWITKLGLENCFRGEIIIAA